MAAIQKRAARSASNGADHYVIVAGVAMLRTLNDDHTAIRPQRGDFQSSLERRRECHCYFFDSMARRSLTSHVDFGAEANTG
jgi:hypothetical protein